MRNPTTNYFGNRYWLSDKNKLIRKDGPAVEWTDGYKEWHDHNGRLYRQGAPAIEDVDGSKVWYIHGDQIV